MKLKITDVRIQRRSECGPNHHPIVVKIVDKSQVPAEFETSQKIGNIMDDKKNYKKL